jgi:PAS domain S-box-containing protein
MSLKTRLYIAFILSLGAAVSGYGLYHWDAPELIRFLCYMAIAVPASCLKVALPGVTGTMSVLFVFLLAGVVELNLPESLAIAAFSAAAQSFWHARLRPRPIHVLFSVANLQIATAATYFTYISIPGLSSPFRLSAAASVFFLANTFPIAVVIALTEGKSIRQVWKDCYFWCFPYYLVGAGIVGVFSFANRLLDWQAGILILPVVYVIYRSYSLYLNKLQTEQKQAEDERAHAAETAVLHARAVEALASALSANNRLDAVFRASPLAVLTLDREGNVAGWNAMAEQIFGWSPEEVVGGPLPVATGRSEAIIHGIIGRTLRGEAISGVEMKQWRRDGAAFNASVWTAALREADAVSGILVTVADVSDRKRLEEQLRLSQKMEAVGRLAGGVAHDFNNLLTVIIGYSTMLIDKVSGDPDALGQAEEILGAGTRAADLVSQLLAFSRRQMIKPRPLEVNQFVLDVQRILERVIGEHVELRTNLRADAGWIHADQNQMEGVLLNLSTNARDAMAEGGVLTIETERVEVLADRPIPGIDLDPGSYVRLAVKDTGLGMDGETQQHLFEPFFTTKEQGKGTGLGLSSVYGGVEQNRGRIGVSSELGKGSEFSIYLPRIEKPESVAAAPAAERNPMRGSETILLVEDETMVRRMLREALAKAGYRIWEAGNGAEAIELWAGRIEEIDLVVTDIVMPVMSGLRLVEELRKRRPGIRVICMSGHSEDVINRQHGAAPLDLLQKPFLPGVLVRKVREVLDQTSGRLTGTSMAASPGSQWGH